MGYFKLIGKGCIWRCIQSKKWQFEILSFEIICEETMKIYKRHIRDKHMNKLKKRSAIWSIFTFFFILLLISRLFSTSSSHSSTSFVLFTHTYVFICAMNIQESWICLKMAMIDRFLLCIGLKIDRTYIPIGDLSRYSLIFKTFMPFFVFPGRTYWVSITMKYQYNSHPMHKNSIEKKQWT